MKNLLKKIRYKALYWKRYCIEVIIITVLVSAFIFLGSLALPQKTQTTFIFKETIEYYPIYPQFERTISKIGSRPYTENYQCYDFSKDLVKELEKIGIKSWIAINKDRTHAFVLVGIEATTGNFTLVDNNLEILELRNKDLDTICD